MYRRSRKYAQGLAFSSAIALAIGGLALPAHAQPDAGATGETIGDIVVTAQFRAQNLQSTPLAITAVNADMLQQRSQTSIEQVAAQAPNVTLKAQAGAWGPSLAASIRGVGGSVDPNPGLDPGVGIYVDDVYYATTVGSVLDLLDLDRVEILRGPQGTLAGQNSIGGAIKLYSKKPSGDQGGYVQATYGSFNRIDLRASADLTVVPDALFMRISGVSRHSRGYVTRIDYACAHPGSGLPTFASRDDCVLGHEGGRSMDAVRAMLRWTPSPDLEVNLIGDYTNDHSEGGAVTLLRANSSNPNTMLNGVPHDSRFVPSDPYVSYATFYMTGGEAGGVPVSELTAEDRSEYRGGGVSGTVNWTIADTLKLTSITAYRKYKSNWASDNDVSPLPLGVGIENLDSDQFSEELRLNGSLGTVIDYTVGGYYLRRESRYFPREDLRFVAPTYDYQYDDTILAHTRALFGQVVAHLGGLNLTGGLRYTHEEKDFAYGRFDPITGGPAEGLGELNGLVGHYKGSRVDYRVAADYHITPDVMAYAQFSTGFRSGGVTPRPFFATQAVAYGPESMDAYEIGLKSSLFDRRVRLNLSAFFNRYKALQLGILSCPQYSPPGLGNLCAVIQNAGNADVKGIEAETEIHPFEGAMIDGSISYLDFDYTYIDPNAGGPDRPGGPQKGDVRPYSPKWKWSIGAQYSIDLGEAGSLTPRVDGSYTSEVYSAARNTATSRIAGYTVFNARLTYKDRSDKWEASLEVTNFTNKLYYVINADLSSFAGFTWGTPARPREWALTLTRRF